VTLQLVLGMALRCLARLSLGYYMANGHQVSMGRLAMIRLGIDEAEVR